MPFNRFLTSSSPLFPPKISTNFPLFLSKFLSKSCPNLYFFTSHFPLFYLSFSTFLPLIFHFSLFNFPPSPFPFFPTVARRSPDSHPTVERRWNDSRTTVERRSHVIITTPSNDSKTLKNQLQPNSPDSKPSLQFCTRILSTADTKCAKM